MTTILWTIGKLALTILVVSFLSISVFGMVHVPSAIDAIWDLDD